MNNDKIQALKAYLTGLAEQDVAVAFSGGVDSSLLLHLCCEAAQQTGSKVYAITLQTDLHPHGDLEIASRVAKEVGAEHVVLYINELEEAGIRMNPVDRCYRCKLSLFRKMLAKAKTLGVSHVLEGTNADDLLVYRPGIKAIRELSILSPFASNGITKAEIRQLASDYSVSVASRPSTPCMATRFPYGTELSYEAMHRVDEAEQWLRSQGFYNVRLRIHGDVTRIEVDDQEMDSLLLQRELVIAELKRRGFDYITLDLEGFRSGSMDIHINKER